MSHITKDDLPIFCKESVLLYSEARKIYCVVTADAYHREAYDETLMESHDLSRCLQYLYSDSVDDSRRCFFDRFLGSVGRARVEERTRIEYAGWVAPFMSTKVGTHPVFNFVKYPPDGFEFIQSSTSTIGWLKCRYKRARLAWTALIFSVKFKARGVRVRSIWRYWRSRGIGASHVIASATKAECTLYPTYLDFIPGSEWMVEIEDMLTLMTPFAHNGAQNKELTPRSEIIKILQVLLQDRRCLGVICHLKSTADGLRLLFREFKEISGKIYDVRLGMPMLATGTRTRKTSEAFGNVTLLFVNGWAQDSNAAFRRGLIDALEIFDRVRSVESRVRLIVRCKLPKLSKRYLDIIKTKGVVLYEEKIPKDKMDELYRSSDILLFPAVRIAVTTLIQAMQNELAIVASDGFGIEEYVKDGMNGLIGAGFRGKGGYIDNWGLFREDYTLSLRANEEVVESCKGRVLELVRSPALLRKMQKQAKAYYVENLGIDRWNQDLGKIFEEAGLLGGGKVKLRDQREIPV